jgi:amidase
VNEIWHGTAGEALAMLRSGRISSLELTQLVLERVDEANPRLNAVVEVAREAALVAAADADRARAAGQDLPLLGLPLTVKEAFRVAGLHSTWGVAAFRDNVADRDATVVRRLRRSGAVVAGTSNVAAMLGDFGQSANEVYGATRNPWDTERSPGGSSGGAAAAVAGGMSFLEYGSDLAGSIRIPAAFCGVYGLKPTAGTVPGSGFAPSGTPDAQPSDLTTLTTLGPLARSAGDLRTALTVTAGPEDPVAQAYAWSLAPSRHRQLADYRVAVVFDHPAAPVSADIQATLRSTVDALVSAGARVVEGWPSDVDAVASHDSFGFFVQAFLALATGSDFDRMPEFLGHERRRLSARDAWRRHFETADVFLCPVAFTTAIAHDQRPFADRTIGDRPYTDLTFWVSQASLPGLPALSAPIGRTSEGLPIGLQIIGPSHEDDTAITFAELLADLVGGYEPPPA